MKLGKSCKQQEKIRKISEVSNIDQLFSTIDTCASAESTSQASQQSFTSSDRVCKTLSLETENTVSSPQISAPSNIVYISDKNCRNSPVLSEQNSTSLPMSVYNVLNGNFVYEGSLIENRDDTPLQLTVEESLSLVVNTIGKSKYH